MKAETKRERSPNILAFIDHFNKAPLFLFPRLHKLSF